MCISLLKIVFFGRVLFIFKEIINSDAHFQISVCLFCSKIFQKIWIPAKNNMNLLNPQD